MIACMDCAQAGIKLGELQPHWEPDDRARECDACGGINRFGSGRLYSVRPVVARPHQPAREPLVLGAAIAAIRDEILDLPVDTIYYQYGSVDEVLVRRIGPALETLDRMVRGVICGDRVYRIGKDDMLEWYREAAREALKALR